MDNKLIDNQYEISTAIDEVAYYIDHKNLTKAMEVFSEDAQLEVYEDGKLTTLCKDKQQIQSVLTEKLKITISFFITTEQKWWMSNLWIRQLLRIPAALLS